MRTTRCAESGHRVIVPLPGLLLLVFHAVVGAAAGAGVGAGVGAQTPARRVEPMTAARVRSLTRDAQSAARGDKNEFVLGLDARVRARWGDFETFPVWVVRRDDLRVELSMPYMTYRRTLAEYLLINRPIKDVPWIAAGVIAVEPSRIDAPDIIRIVVERDGQSVPPLQNLLRPMRFANGNGGEAMLNAGEVRFPMSAFAPGARVTMTAVARTGPPFAMALGESQLQTLK